MSDLNVTTVMGRLVRKPMLKNSRSRMAFFTIASNQRYRDDAGVLQQETAFVACKVFGAWCDALTDRLQGDTVIVSGRLRTESWEKDGAKRTQLVLIGNAVHSVCSSGGSADSFGQREPVTDSTSAGGKMPADEEQPPF